MLTDSKPLFFAQLLQLDYIIITEYLEKKAGLRKPYFLSRIKRHTAAIKTRTLVFLYYATQSYSQM